MADKSKFEREIDEILEKSEDIDPQNTAESKPATSGRRFEPFTPTVPKRPARRRASTIKISPSTLVVAGIVVFAIAAFSPAAKLPIAVIGLALLLVGYYLWFRSGSSFSGGFGAGRGMFGGGRSPKSSNDSEPQVKYWRGRRIEEKPQQQDRGKIIEFGSADDDEDSRK